MARPNKLTKLIVAPAAAVLLAAAGCAEEVGGGEDTEAGDDVELLNDDTLVTCTHLPYEPFQFKEGNEIVGFDVDLVDLVAEELGVEQEIFDTGFEGIETGAVFEQDECDLSAAAMTITDERAEVMDFSDGYFDANQALLVQEDSDIAALEDLDGQTLGVQQGTTGEKYGEEHKDEHGYKTRQFEDVALLQQAVVNGQVDVAINDNSVMYDFVENNDGVEVTDEFDTGEEYGIAVRQGNGALLSVVNDVLAEAKEDGTYDEIFAKWFPEADQPES